MRKQIAVAGLLSTTLGAGCSASPEEGIETADALHDAAVRATFSETTPKVRIDGQPYNAPLQEVVCHDAGGQQWWVWRPEGGNIDPGTLNVRITGTESGDTLDVVQFIGAPGWPSLVYPDNAKWQDLPGDTVEFTRTESGLTLRGNIYEDSEDEYVKTTDTLPIHTFEAEVGCPEGWQSGY